MYKKGLYPIGNGEYGLPEILVTPRKAGFFAPRWPFF
jgi:hypothetical protein